MPEQMIDFDSQRKTKRDRGVKSILAAMNAVNNIQQNQNKLLMLRLENDIKFRNDFMMNMAKNKQEIEQKKELMPFELEQKKQEKAIISPMEQSQIERNRAMVERYKRTPLPEDPLQKAYRDYVNKHLEVQPTVPERYRTKPISFEEYKKMFSMPKQNGTPSFTDDIITQLDTYTDPSQAINDFSELYGQRGDEIEDKDVIIEAFRDKFGDDAVEELKDKLGL